MEYTAKDIAELFDNLPKKETVDTLLDQVKGIDARLAEIGKPPEVPATDPEVTLEKKGFFDDIMSFEFQGIPIGQAAVGGFAAIFASELVDGFMADSEDWKRGLVKLGIAGVAAKWGKRFLGSTGSKAVALLLAFDGIRDLSPINSWADQLAEKISGTVTTAGLAGNTSNRKAEIVVKKGPSNGYYSMALGGSN